MIRRVGVVGLSFLSLSFILMAAAPKREAAPKKDSSPAREKDSDSAEPRVRGALVVTEIMYDPQSGESDDVQTEWVELKNVGQQAINLRGLQLTSGTKGKIHDPKQRFVLGEATIAPGAYAVIGIGAAKCYATFKMPPFAANCDEAKYAWLTNTGDSVAIRDEKGRIIDEVVYETESPWPAATRNGYSIQFVPPDGQSLVEANDDPKNWVVSGASNSDEIKAHGRGTPGGPPKSDGSGATTQPVLAKHKK
jgi:hypothetical protein